MFFLLGEADDVPLLPVTALGKRMPSDDNAEGQAYQVTVKLADSGPGERTVHVGLMNRQFAQIRAGLNEGDGVIVASPAGEPGSGEPRRFPMRL